jgi:hypothetical protein
MTEIKWLKRINTILLFAILAWIILHHSQQNQNGRFVMVTDPESTIRVLDTRTGTMCVPLREELIKNLSAKERETATPLCAILAQRW